MPGLGQWAIDIGGRRDYPFLKFRAIPCPSRLIRVIPFMIDRAMISEAAKLLLQAAPTGSEVILFGSHARGDATPDSDLDFLVVEPEVKSKHSEMVRLRDALRPLRCRPTCWSRAARYSRSGGTRPIMFFLKHGRKDSHSMKWDEQAERLRRKAAGDEEAMSALLAVSSVPDEVIGFHAQQAVEKLLKALLEPPPRCFPKDA